MPGMRSLAAASMLVSALALSASGCDRPRGSTNRPEDDSLHMPRMGTGEFHAEEQQRPKEEPKHLPRTSPRTFQDALQKEIEVAEHIVELWWASRPVHDEAEDSRVHVVFSDLRDVARAMDTPEPYTEALRFALCSLGDGHLRLVDDPATTRRYFSGLHFDRAGEDIVVSGRSVSPGKGAAPSPEGGDKLIAADDTPIEEWLDRLCLVPGSSRHHRHAVAVASLRQQVRYLHEQPTPRELTLQRKSGETYTVKVDWRAQTEPNAAPCVKASILDKKTKVGELKIRTFYCLDKSGQLSDLAFESQLELATKALAKAKVEHVVVDLRGNAGGTEWSARQVLGVLAGERAVFTRQRTRHPYRATTPLTDIEHTPDEETPLLSSRRLWILADAGCADACELLVGAMHGREGVKVVGRTTAGSVGQSAIFRLPYSGLQIAVPVTEHAVPGSDVTIEGRGIVPDIEVIRARSDIGTSTDADVEIVLDRIRKRAEKKANKKKGKHRKG